MSNDDSFFGGYQQGKVLFDFVPQAINQISLKVGQVINITSYGGPGSWSQGAELGSGKVGFFPSDYVQLIPKALKQIAPPHIPIVPKIKTVEKLMAKSLYDFSGSRIDEMSFKVGETFEVLEKGPAGAWSKGLRGVFPTDYVQFITVPSSHCNPTSLPARGIETADIGGINNTRRRINTTGAPNPFATAAASLPPKSLPSQDTAFAIVLYSRAADGPAELTITEGETILVIKQDMEWWYGSTTGQQPKTGYFPRNYVTLTNKLPLLSSETVPVEN
eukprot:gene1865-2524_t